MILLRWWTGGDITATKRRANAKQGFAKFQAARQTIQGYEAMNIIRKGQTRWLSVASNASKWPPGAPENDAFSANSCSVRKLATPPFGLSYLQHGRFVLTRPAGFRMRAVSQNEGTSIGHVLVTRSSGWLIIYSSCRGSRQVRHAI
jgi:hypothetical protein